MSSTGIRPPLFDPDPEPEGFDAAKAPGTQQFPQKRSSGGKGHPRTRSSSSSSSSPRWVRPFIFGGLVLIAVISLVSILAGGDGAPTADDQPTPAPAAALPPADPDAAQDLLTDATAVDDQAVDDQAVDDAGDLAEDADVAPGTVASQATALPADDAARPVGSDTAPMTASILSPELQGATAFAVQFSHDYLNYDQAQPEVRERDLRAYLAPDLNPQLGWDGQGTQVAVLTVPIQTVVDGDRVVVTVAAQVTGQDAPRWVHLAVPLAHDTDMRWAVVAQPAYVPRPGPGNPASDPVGEVDQELSGALTTTMEQLFRAYATEGAVAIGGVTAPGATIRGLQDQVSFVKIDEVRIMAGDDTARTGSVTVTWNDAITGGSVSQTYVVDLAASDGGWLVAGVSVS